MKKMILGSLLALTCATAFADNQVVTPQTVTSSESATVPFQFYNTNQGRVVQVTNPDIGMFKIFVQTDETVNDNSGYAVTADTITVTCHGTAQDVPAGSATFCVLSTGDTMTIVDKSYKWGVNGSYTVLSPVTATKQ